MQHPENAFHAFLGIQPGENMVFLLFERKDVKIFVIALAIFRQQGVRRKQLARKASCFGLIEVSDLLNVPVETVEIHNRNQFIQFA
ncbi:hypothetical protein AB9G74_10865 [Escherichia coli]